MVSVTLNGQVLLGHIFNASTVDGRFGLIATGGTATFDDVRVKTDDPAFLPEEEALVTSAESSETVGAVLTMAALEPLVAAAIERLTVAFDLDALQQAALADADFAIVDLPGATLGRHVGGVIELDIDAAGHGWFIDPTPFAAEEFTADGRAIPGSASSGAIDLLTAITHELGHLLRFDHDSLPFMAEVLDPGERLDVTLEEAVESGGTGPKGPPAKVRGLPNTAGGASNVAAAYGDVADFVGNRRASSSTLAGRALAPAPAIVIQAESASIREIALAADAIARVGRPASIVLLPLGGDDPVDVDRGQEQRVDARTTTPQPRSADDPVRGVNGSTPAIAVVGAQRPTSVESGAVVDIDADDGFLAAPLAATLSQSRGYSLQSGTGRLENRPHKPARSRRRAMPGAPSLARRRARAGRPRRCRAPARAPCRAVTRRRHAP
jgi:hypothetical protein